MPQPPLTQINYGHSLGRIFINSNKASNPRAKGRGKFYLVVLAAIAISALVGACACEDSPTLELTYPPIIGTIDSEIGETAPEWSGEPGEAVEYKIEPALPEGLSLNPGTGIILGTPKAVITQEYTITAILASGTVKETTISITIEDTSEGVFFTYEPIVGAVDGEIAPAAPQWDRTLSEEITYTIDPELPAGLTFDSAAGTISGTPEAIWEGSHTVTAAYGGKEKTGVVTITVLSKNTLPGPPTALTVVTGDETAQVGWTAPDNTGLVDNAAGTISGYKVYWDEVAAPTKASAFLLIGDSAAVSAEVPGLTNGRFYYFAAAAFNQLGEGELSEAIAAPASKPGKLAVPSAVPSGQAITVSWLPPLSETVGAMEALTGYKVYYRETAAGGDELVQEVGPETTSVTFEGLEDGTYSFRVTAAYGQGENAGESESSDSKEILLSQTSPQDNAVPGQPWNVKAEAGNGEISITWSAPADTGIVNGQKADITSYTVYYDVGTGINDITQSSFYSLEFPDTSAEPSLMIGALANGTAYVIAVTASNDEGEGFLSAPVTSQPREENRPPTAPTITNTIAMDGEVKLIWSPPADTGMKDGKAGSLTAYGVYFARGEAPTESSDVRMVFSDTSLDIDELENGTPYQFALRAYTTAGESGLSDPREAAPTEGDRVPAAPTDVQVSAGDGKLTVRWKEDLDTGLYNNQKGTIQHFRVYYGRVSIDLSTTAYETRAFSDPPEDPWTLTIDGLTNGGTYNLGVTTFNEVGEGELSSIKKLTLAPDRTVSFDVKGSSSSVPDQTVTYGSVLTEPAPALTGYALGGWYTQDGSSGGQWGDKWDFTKGVDTATETMTLYARWYSPPSAPGNLAVSSYDDDSVTLSWDGSNNPGSSGGADAAITDYKVYYSTTDPVDTSSASSVSTNTATTARISGLTSSTSYYFVVLAANSVGLESAPSNEAAQTTDLSDTEKAAADKADLDITSAAGGDLQAVKADFTLPVTGGRGTAISWAVTSGTAIALGGTNGENADVTRPTALGSDDIVVLRAAITLGSASETKDFTLTVKKVENLTDQESVDQDRDALTVDSFQFAQGDTYTQITQDFTLPITGGEGSEISWTLTSGSAVSLSGTRNGTAAVTRPDYLDGSAAVELEAAITKGSVSDTKSFTLTVYRKDQVNIASLDSAVFSLTVADTSVTVLTGGTHTAAVTGSLAAGTDYVLSIEGTGVTSGAVSIDNGGTITITGGIALTDAGDYTVTAVGQGSYSGTVSDTFTLGVDPPTLGEISYADADFTLDVNIVSQFPIGTNSGQADYAMKAGESLPEGLSIYTNNGQIHGTPTVGSPPATYTIVATGKTGTIYEGDQKELTIRISVDNAVDTFFDFDLPAAEVDAQKNGADIGQDINITRNDRNFIEDGEYRWAITKLNGTTPGFMAVTSNKLWITGADIPGSSAAGTFKLTAVGQGRYSGEITKEFELKLPADAPIEAPAITGIAPRDGALAVSWIAPADRGYYDGGEGVITEYTVYWDTASGLTASTAANSQTVLPANNSYEIASLTNGQTYYFIVTAATAVGEGPASSEGSAQPSSGNTPPGMPSIVSAAAGNAQVEVGWTAPADPGLVNNQPGSPSYRIYYSRTPDFGLGQADGYREAANSARSLVVDQLTNLTKYYFRVTAYTGSGESSPSTAVLTATPRAAVFDANGGSGAPAEAMLPLLTGKIPDYSYGTLERSGYAFAGWNTAADGSGDTYRSGEDYSFQDVTTLYAYWLEATAELKYTLINNNAEYTVTYNKAGLTQAQVDLVTSVVIPAYWQEKPVTEIGQPVSVPTDERAFFQYMTGNIPQLEFRNLESVTMPEGIIKIHEGAFAYASLTSLTSLPDSVTHIGSYSFQRTSIALTSFPSSFSWMGISAFENVTTLTATEFPANVTMRDYPFRNADLAFNNLENVTLSGKQHFQKARFTNPAVTLSTLYWTMYETFEESNVTSVDITLKSTGKSVFRNTFKNCTSLQTVTLRFGSGIVDPQIPHYAEGVFSGCSSLTAIYVPSLYVDEYKTAAGWSSFAGIIEAIPGS